MSEYLMVVFLIAAWVGLVWSLLQPDPFIRQVEKIINKLEKRDQP